MEGGSEPNRRPDESVVITCDCLFKRPKHSNCVQSGSARVKPKSEYRPARPKARLHQQLLLLFIKHVSQPRSFGTQRLCRNRFCLAAGLLKYVFLGGAIKPERLQRKARWGPCNAEGLFLFQMHEELETRSL